MRIGNGYDVHALVPGRKLVLGGVEIDWHLGLQGHSDADVVLHAICDACLGAAAMGDIGAHFPPGDDTYKNIDSRKLLREVAIKLKMAGWQVSNVDCTVIAEKPYLSPFIPEMKRNISADLSISAQHVNIKATTTEGLGYLGKQKGIAALAVALIESTN